MTMFKVLSLWLGHCECSLGSVDECRLSTKQPPTLRPRLPTWAVSHLHPLSPFIRVVNIAIKVSLSLVSRHQYCQYFLKQASLAVSLIHFHQNRNTHQRYLLAASRQQCTLLLRVACAFEYRTWFSLNVQH